MYRHGVAGTSTPAVRDAAGVSSSQIYHYFADKDDLTRAVIAFQTEAILSYQAASLARLDSLDALRAWRDVVVDAARQQHGAGGCPLGSLSSELSDDHSWARDALAASFTAWSEAIRTGLAAMTVNGTLRPGTDPGRTGLVELRSRS
jgi:TetR/AcrR family transcriptional regulator, transcriptional repressor for nem operon